MTDHSESYILAVNCGSSSLKFGLFDSFSGKMERTGMVGHIGTEGSLLEIRESHSNIVDCRVGPFKTLDYAVEEVIKWLKENEKQFRLNAIGHRLVQGGPDHRVPELINDSLLQTLQHFAYLAPNHLPDEIKAIKAFQTAFPNIQQVACFDTSFHRNMPSHAKYYPLPEEYKENGLMRYGFHGLSYEFIMLKLSERHASLNKKKIIIAHLGNGASMAAIKKGTGIETTMGLSPIGGLVMGTRSGDLDPGVFLFLLKQTKMSEGKLDELLSKRSGLKAIAGISDVKELLKNEENDPNCHEALTVFCYQVKKYIGALTAAMGGLDILIFTGGIGENAAVIRERICHDMNFLGIKIDEKLNRGNRKIISCKSAKVKVQVVKTNEEQMIAYHTQNIINHRNL